MRGRTEAESMATKLVKKSHFAQSVMSKADMKRINGMPRWLYRLRFIVAGVRCFHWRHWFVPSAWGAVAGDFDNTDDERHDGYSPEESAIEALSYWDAE